MIGVVDYGAGNLGSVMNALARLGAEARFVRGPEELSPTSGAGGVRGGSPYEKIIFPGDGHFATAMESLERSGYAEALRLWIAADRPFLGICIGLQLLFGTSDEAHGRPAVPAGPDGSAVPATPPTRGLGVLAGTVKRFPVRKVPLIGWNSTSPRPGAPLFTGVAEGTFFYYIHSYYAAPEDDAVVAAEAEYGLRYCSAVQRGALAALQFHPEKSGPAGLALLGNWVGGGNAR